VAPGTLPGTVWPDPFIGGSSQCQRRIALGTHNFAGDVVLGSAAHFKAGDHPSAVASDKVGVVRRFNLRMPSVKIARLNRKPVSEHPHCPLDDLVLGAQMRRAPFFSQLICTATPLRKGLLKTCRFME
jgi:hypothetical protein